MIRYRTTCLDLCQFVMCLVIFVTACQPAEEIPDNLSGFYLPVKSFPAEGMIYTYRNVLDSAAGHEVWQHSLTSAGRIMSINFDNRQQVVQKQFERILDNGVMIDSLLLFSPVDSGDAILIPVKVLSPNRFPFDAVDSSKVWLTKLEWWQPDDSLHIVLERRRRFIGHTTWKSDGMPVPAIKFRTEDKLETEEVGWTTSTWTGEEVYAKNIGLVRYTRNISEQFRLEYQLISRKPVLINKD